MSQTDGLPLMPLGYARLGVEPDFEREERLAATARLFSLPDLLDTICDHIVVGYEGQGGTVAELARLWHISYGSLGAWIARQPGGVERVAAAKEERDQASKEKILLALRRMADADLSAFYAEDGTLLDPEAWPKHLAGLVASVESQEMFSGVGAERELTGYVRKIKFWDKLKAIELLGKNLAMFTDRHEVSGVLKLDEMLRQSITGPAGSGAITGQGK